MGMRAFRPSATLTAQGPRTRLYDSRGCPGVLNDLSEEPLCEFERERRYILVREMLGASSGRLQAARTGSAVPKCPPEMAGFLGLLGGGVEVAQWRTPGGRRLRLFGAEVTRLSMPNSGRQGGRAIPVGAGSEQFRSPRSDAGLRPAYNL